jgi:hypothetical protein
MSEQHASQELKCLYHFKGEDGRDSALRLAYSYPLSMVLASFHMQIESCIVLTVRILQSVVLTRFKVVMKVPGNFLENPDKWLSSSIGHAVQELDYERWSTTDFGKQMIRGKAKGKGKTQDMDLD